MTLFDEALFARLTAAIPSGGPGGAGLFQSSEWAAVKSAGDDAGSYDLLSRKKDRQPDDLERLAKLEDGLADRVKAAIEVAAGVLEKRVKSLDVLAAFGALYYRSAGFAAVNLTLAVADAWIAGAWESLAPKDDETKSESIPKLDRFASNLEPDLLRGAADLTAAEACVACAGRIRSALRSRLAKLAEEIPEASRAWEWPAFAEAVQRLQGRGFALTSHDPAPEDGVRAEPATTKPVAAPPSGPFDLARVKAPIRADAPTGDNLAAMADDDWSRLKELQKPTGRSETRDPPPTASEEAVRIDACFALAGRILTEKTKDWRVALRWWLAGVEKLGAAALPPACEMLIEFGRTFGDEAFPKAKSDPGYDTRIDAFEDADGRAAFLMARWTAQFAPGPAGAPPRVTDADRVAAAYADATAARAAFAKWESDAAAALGRGWKSFEQTDEALKGLLALPAMVDLRRRADAERVRASQAPASSAATTSNPSSTSDAAPRPAAPISPTSTAATPRIDVGSALSGDVDAAKANAVVGAGVAWLYVNEEREIANAAWYVATRFRIWNLMSSYPPEESPSEALLKEAKRIAVAVEKAEAVRATEPLLQALFECERQVMNAPGAAFALDLHWAGLRALMALAASREKQAARFASAADAVRLALRTLLAVRPAAIDVMVEAAPAEGVDSPSTDAAARRRWLTTEAAGGAPATGATEDFPPAVSEDLQRFDAVVAEGNVGRSLTAMSAVLAKVPGFGRGRFCLTRRMVRQILAAGGGTPEARASVRPLVRGLVDEAERLGVREWEGPEFEAATLRTCLEALSDVDDRPEWVALRERCVGRLALLDPGFASSR